MVNETEAGSLVKEHLAAKLKEAIVEGRVRPGERIVEGTWAREFGVAQASVREAINLLIADGYLVKNAGHSARVTQYSEQDITRIYEIRGSLEGLAAQLANERRADLTAVEAALERMEDAFRREDVRGLVTNDLAFHLLLAEASGNPLLAETLERLLRPLFAFVLLRMLETQTSPSKWEPDMQRHREAIYLIRESSPAVAGQYMQFCVGRFGVSAQAVWAPAEASGAKTAGAGRALGA